MRPEDKGNPSKPHLAREPAQWMAMFEGEEKTLYSPAYWSCTIPGGVYDTGAVGVGDTIQEAYINYLEDKHVTSMQLERAWAEHGFLASRRAS